VKCTILILNTFRNIFVTLIMDKSQVSKNFHHVMMLKSIIFPNNNIANLSCKRLYIYKRRPQSGGREACPVWTFCGQKSFFRCGRQHFWCKNLGFSKFMVCPHGQRTKGGEVEPGWTFCGQEGTDQFFAILCGRPLWTFI